MSRQLFRRFTLVVALVALVCPEAPRPGPAAAQDPVPLPEEVAAAQRIDAALATDRAARWAQLNRPSQRGEATDKPLPPLPAEPPRSSDALFLRRACVDIAGRLPSADEARAFAADPAHDKRAHLIDRLAMEPGATEVRLRWLTEALRVPDAVAGAAQTELIGWLRNAVAEDQGLSAILIQLLGGLAPQTWDPQLGWAGVNDGDAMRTACDLGTAFLGVDLHCARCHDHPYADWTQKQLHEWAACFAPFTSGYALPLNYLYRDAAPGQMLTARYLPVEPMGRALLRNAFGEAPRTDSISALRSDVGAWLTHDQNEAFALTAARRVWLSMLGEPEVGSTAFIAEPWPAEPYHRAKGNPGNSACAGPRSRSVWMLSEHRTAESALDRALVAEFRRCGGRLRELQRIIARSAAYQLDTKVVAHGEGVVLSPAPPLRRLPAEVVWDALANSLPDQHPALGYDPRPSHDQAQVPAADHPLRVLGRGARDWPNDSAAPISHALARLMIASTVVTHAANHLGKRGADAATVESYFWSLLSRAPSAAELDVARRHADEHPTTAGADIIWALLNTKEFLFSR